MINNKEKNFISAVIYLNSSSREITKFLVGLNNVLSDNFLKYEIICVNDGAKENCLDEVRTFSRDIDGAVVSIVNMSYVQGMEISMKAGMDFAIGDFVYEFDGIGVDYDWNIIMDVYRQSLKGFDIVSAVPKSKSKSASRLFYKIFNSNSNSMYKLQTQTFRIISRRGINRVQAMNKSIPYRKAIYANCGLNLYFLEYEINNKLEKVDYDKKESLNLATDSLVIFTNVAYKFSLTMSIIFLISTIAVAGYSAYMFFNKTVIEGWTTTMLFMAFSFFGIFLFFAVIIKYLSIMMDMIFKKQEYLIKSVDKLTR